MDTLCCHPKVPQQWKGNAPEALHAIDAKSEALIPDDGGKELFNFHSVHLSSGRHELASARAPKALLNLQQLFKASLACRFGAVRQPRLQPCKYCGLPRLQCHQVPRTGAKAAGSRKAAISVHHQNAGKLTPPSELHTTHSCPSQIALDIIPLEDSVTESRQRAPQQGTQHAACRAIIQSNAQPCIAAKELQISHQNMHRFCMRSLNVATKSRLPVVGLMLLSSGRKPKKA